MAGKKLRADRSACHCACLMAVVMMMHLTDKGLVGTRWLDESLGPEKKKAPKMAHWMDHNLEPRIMREDHWELKTAIWLERLKEK
eukprot:4838791-Ditylum_brightwellii.AAC.1